MNQELVSKCRIHHDYSVAGPNQVFHMIGIGASNSFWARGKTSDSGSTTLDA
jgi:hypothetical protein